MQPQENPCRVFLGLQGNSTEGFFLKKLYCLQYVYPSSRGGGAGAVAKADCLECRGSGVRTPLRPSGFKETVSSPLTPKYSILWGASVTER